MPVARRPICHDARRTPPHFVNWSDFLQVLRCRAIEDADASGRLWSADQRRQATATASARAGTGPAALLAERSRILLEAAPADVLRQMAAPSLPGWLFPCIAVVALILGWSLVGIGQEREINLLALPLVGLLVWNVAVLIASLFTGIAHRTEGPAPAWVESLLKRFSPAPSTDSAAAQADAVARFRALSVTPALSRAACLSKALLHTGAALLALGSVCAMYAHGWSNEYRAVWESTLLGEHGVATFFQWMFAPASAVSGLPIPLAELPAMHRTLTAPALHPGQALPWIHLYALTLVLGIVLPRLCFAAWERWRGGRVADAALATQAWKRHAEDLLADALPRGNEPAILLMHAAGNDAAAVARWTNGVLSAWRETGHVNAARITAGEEEEFLRRWQPDAARIAFAFSLATVPEEMHREFLVQASARAKEKQPAARLLLLLDAAALEQRWRGMAGLQERLDEKAALWRRAAEGTGMELRILHAGAISSA